MSLERLLCFVHHSLDRNRSFSPFGAASRVGPSSGAPWVVEAGPHHLVAVGEAVLDLVGVLAENHGCNDPVGSVRHGLEGSARRMTTAGTDVVTGMPKRDAIAKLNRKNNSDCKIREKLWYYTNRSLRVLNTVIFFIEDGRVDGKCHSSRRVNWTLCILLIYLVRPAQRGRRERQRHGWALCSSALSLRDDDELVLPTPLKSRVSTFHDFSMNVPGDESTSDYDPLFDEGEAGSDNGLQEEPGHSNSPANTLAESSHCQLALPKYVGSSPTAPMRSVENVGTIALPVSPQFFAERPCTPSSSAASHIASKKRQRDIGDDNDSDRPCSVRARVSDSTQSSRGGSTTSDRATTRDVRGLPILVPRPKHLPSKPSDEGPFSSGIISFLTHDADFTAAIRSYVYLLANPPEFRISETSEGTSPHTTKHGRTKGRKKVPANAADWDVPYPFPDGEAPRGYLETWSLEKAKSLSNTMLSAVRRAVTKLELLQAKRKASEIPIDAVSSTREISEKASVAIPPVMDWIRGAVKNEGNQMGIDISSLPPRIADILTGFQPPSVRIDEPILGKDIVTAVRDGITDVQNSLREQTPAQTGMVHEDQTILHAPDLPLEPFDFAMYQLSGDPLPQASCPVAWGDLATHSGSPGTSFGINTLTASGQAAAIPPSTLPYPPASQLSLDQLLDPSLLFAHEANAPLLAGASAQGSPTDMPNAERSEQTVVDWLLAGLNDPNGFSNISSPTGTGSGTPLSSNNALPPLPPSSLTFCQTPTQSHPASGVGIALKPYSNLNSKRKRVPTKQEIMELQRQTASSMLNAASGPHGCDERTLVVKDVRSRAGAVRSRLREELAAVERELWALDIEREVLSEVQRSVGEQ